MLKTYEATYEDGKLRWVKEIPNIQNGAKVSVTVDVPDDVQRREEEIRKVLDEACGAWGTGKTLEEIDREIETVRKADWSRGWKSGDE